MSTEPAALVSENLDLWTSAIERKSGAGRGGGNKVSQYGIVRLRGLILDLAVRGKLVPQDAQDESVASLLTRIDNGRAKLVDDGFIQGTKSAVDRARITGAYPIPPSWAWVRLDRLGAIVGGGTPSAADSSNFTEPGQGIAWLTPADLSGFKEKFIGRGQRDLTHRGAKASSAKVMPTGTVLFTSRAPIGYVAIAANAIATNQGFKSIVPSVEGLSEFIALFLKASAEEIDANAPGTTFKEVSGKIVGALPFSLPPLAEQRRIVAKVDALLALCDALETQSASALEAHQALVETLLATLVSADPADLASQWARLETHFDTLFSTDGSVEALKKNILNLAVSGRLTEPTGTTKVGALDDVGKWIGGNGFPVEFQGNTSGEFPFLKVSDMNLPGNEREITVSNNWISRETVEKVRARVHPAGTIIFPKIGGAIATNKRRILTVPSAIDNNCAGQIPHKGIDVSWLYLILSSIDMSQYQAGSSVPALNMKRLGQHRISIPSEEDQLCIVAKADGLLSLCEALRARLTDAAQTCKSLADAIVEHAAA